MGGHDPAGAGHPLTDRPPGGAAGTFACLTTGTADARRWASVAGRLDELDLLWTLDYARFSETAVGGEVRLAVHEGRRGLAAMPFVRRPVEVPAATGGGGPWWDVASLYPFGGPLTGGTSSAAVRAELVGDLGRAFGEWCRGHSVVAQFTAFHPLLANHRAVAESGAASVEHRKEVVWIDLERGEDEHRRGLSKGHRAAIGQARRAGVRVERETPVPGGEGLTVFEALYAETMRRVDGAARWRFSPAYFRACAEWLGDGRASLFRALRDGETLAGALVLHDERTAYLHLMASRAAAWGLRPNHLLVVEAARWARALGCRRFLLGGGVRPGDGVERFKAGFARTRAGFHTAGVVHDPETYRRLCEAVAGSPAAGGGEPEAGFFPAYRR